MKILMTLLGASPRGIKLFSYKFESTQASGNLTLSRLTNLIVALSIHIIFAEPGGSYTLTGNEKSIEAIIKTDMEQHPDLYIGESLRSYMAKFKNENKIGRSKLAPGDKLVFPDTKISLKAKATAKRQLLLGSWKSEFKTGLVMVTTYKENGDFAVVVGNNAIIFSGIWEMKDNSIRSKITDQKIWDKKERSSGKWVENKIVLLTDKELHLRVEGEEEVNKHIRIN